MPSFFRAAVRLLDLLDDLLALELRAKNYRRIVEAITQKGTFHSATFEATVASDYLVLGYDVKVVEESKNGKKPPTY